MAEVTETGRRVEQLLDSLASASEPQLRMHAEELVSLLLSLYGEGLARIVSLATEQVRTRLTEDELVCELLILHGLHPVDVETRVRATLGAEAELVEVTADGVARLRWIAPQSGCGSGHGRGRLEAAILAAVSDVTSVEIEQAVVSQAGPLIPVESLFRDRTTAAGR